MKLFIDILKQTFTWWHKQTLGTFIYTLFEGKLIGIDEFGNKYYSNTKNKRWVIYKSRIESSKIPPEWHLWMHSTRTSKPGKSKKYSWQKDQKENLTGTQNAYKPEGSLLSKTKTSTKKYETWKL